MKDLKCGPFCRWRIRDVEVDDSSPLVSQNDEDKQHSKAQCGHGQEIDGDQFADVVLRKRPPFLRGRFSASDHVLGDRGLRDLNS